MYNTVVKKIANIDLKVPDVEWQTTGRKVRPPASNENPALEGVGLCQIPYEILFYPAFLEGA